MLEQLRQVLEGPLEVKILGSLAALVGIMLVLAGLSSVGESAASLRSLSIDALRANPVSMSMQAAGAAVGVAILPAGLAFLAMTVGMFMGKRWAWTGCLGAVGAGVAFSVFRMSQQTDPSGLMGYMGAIAISGIIVGYLFTPEIKEFFGRAAPVQQPAQEEQAEEVQENTAVTES